MKRKFYRFNLFVFMLAIALLLSGCFEVFDDNEGFGLKHHQQEESFHFGSIKTSDSAVQVSGRPDSWCFIALDSYGNDVSGVVVSVYADAETTSLVVSYKASEKPKVFKATQSDYYVKVTGNDTNTEYGLYVYCRYYSHSHD